MKKALLVLAFFLPMVDGSDSSAAPFVYVSSPAAGVVKVIDQAANGVAGAIQLVATIPVGGQPTGLALNESGTMLYVANTSLHRVDFIDTKTRLVTASVPTVGAPFLLTYDQASGKLYVVISSMTFGDYPIVVIDTTRQAVIATIPSSISIAALQVDRARGVIYALHASSTITVISTSTDQIVGTLSNRSDLFSSGFSLDATGSRLYIADGSAPSGFDIPFGSSIVAVVDVLHNSIATSIDVQDDPTSIIADPGRPFVYVGAFRHLIAIDTRTNTVAWTIATPQGSGPIALSDDDSLLFFGSFESDVVTVVDLSTRQIVASIPVSGPFALATVPGGFVTGFVTPVCSLPEGCVQFSPSAPNSSQKVAVSIAVTSGIPDDACIRALTKSVVENLISISGTYVHCYDVFFLPPVTYIDTSLEPLAAGHYTMQFTASADPNYGPNGWVLGPDGWVRGPISITAALDVAPSSIPANYQGLWWSAPAGSESGWGLALAHQGDLIFVSWFTYDLTGKAWWLVMTASKTADGVYSGMLYQASGPAFDSVPFPPVGATGGATGSTVGTATLTFSDASNGTFAYTVNGVSQSKAITREEFGPQPNCTFGIETDLTLTQNYQDLWWAAPAGSEAGWGINLAHQGDTIYGTWFTYDYDRTPMWLVVTAPKTALGTFTGDLYRATGPAFNTVPFPPLGSPGAATGSVVGSATFTFTNGNYGTLASTISGAVQIKAITRQVFVAPGTVCQ